MAGALRHCGVGGGTPGLVLMDKRKNDDGATKRYNHGNYTHPLRGPEPAVHKLTTMLLRDSQLA